MKTLKHAFLVQLGKFSFGIHDLAIVDSKSAIPAGQQFTGLVSNVRTATRLTLAKIFILISLLLRELKIM